ncbi:MAG TPA: aminotransferase class V-fold PLP-dependent enzyme, partial [Candidatus Eisenbacteria bacterium]|nr:aminotransferase class V-fold PLP-dependent enzyme [Candidatus Eisenbacteria bacterium]
GTENVAAIVGFGVAAARAQARLAAGAPARIAALGERLLDGLLARVPGARLNGDRARRWGGIVNVGFEGVDGEALLHELDRDGVVVSTGSACSAAHAGPSHVLLALGLTPEDAHASIRFSLGDGNDDADVDRILQVVPGAIERLRALDRPAAAGAGR